MMINKDFLNNSYTENVILEQRQGFGLVFSLQKMYNLYEVYIEE